MSGEDFISHSIAVALILAEQLLDTTSIAAALLHDVVEDSEVRTEDMAREFGPEITGNRGWAHQDLAPHLPVLGGRAGRELPQAAAESIAQDARVIIIKLADRLHNMRTLEHLPPERRSRIALETARSTRRWRTASAWRHQGGAGGPGLQVPRARRSIAIW
jgi:GTP pyrophosphokinase